MRVRLVIVVPCIAALIATAAAGAGEKADWGKLKGAVQRELGSTDPDVRIEAVRKLAQADCLDAVKMLVDLIDHPDPALRKAEAERDAYEQDYYDAARRFEKLVQQGKGQVAVNDAEERDRVELKWRGLNAMVDALSDLSREAARGLGGATDAEAVAWLVKTAPVEATDRVREALARALGSMVPGDVDVVPALDKMAQDKRPRVRTAAIDSLAAKKATQSAGLIAGALEDDAWQVRAAAVEALGALDQRSSVGALIARMQNETGRLREDFERALGRLTGWALGPDPKAWKGWWETNQAAWEAGTLEKKKVDAAAADQGPGQTVAFFGITTKSKNIVFVLDISGSMNEPANFAEEEKVVATGGGSGGGGGGGAYVPKADEKGKKIGIAKGELHRALGLLPSDTSFNIIFYSTEVKLYSNAMVQASDANKGKAQKYVHEIKAEGGTNIHDALEKAFNLIRKPEENFEKGVDTIFFLTDGMPTVGKVVDPTKIQKLVREWNQTRRIRIHTIGIGTHDRAMMEALAKENGGNYAARN